jgi:hypothetical protein
MSKIPELERPTTNYPYFGFLSKMSGYQDPYGIFIAAPIFRALFHCLMFVPFFINSLFRIMRNGVPQVNDGKYRRNYSQNPSEQRKI